MPGSIRCVMLLVRPQTISLKLTAVLVTMALDNNHSVVTCYKGFESFTHTFVCFQVEAGSSCHGWLEPTNDCAKWLKKIRTVFKSAAANIRNFLVAGLVSFVCLF